MTLFGQNFWVSKNVSVIVVMVNLQKIVLWRYHGHYHIRMFWKDIWGEGDFYQDSLPPFFWDALDFPVQVSDLEFSGGVPTKY